MTAHNADIAETLSEIADLLELQGADVLRVRAYRRAAKALPALAQGVRALRHAGASWGERLGIDDAPAEAVGEIVTLGRSRLLERLRAEVPQDLSALRQVADLGPQRVRTLHQELGVQTMEQLRAAARDGRIQTLPGFGPRLQHKILKATTAHLARARRLRLDAADPPARALCAWLAQLPDVQRVEISGSLRRGLDSVAGIDLLAQSDAAMAAIDALTNRSDVREVPLAGRARAGVVLADGLRVNLQVAPADGFGAAWLLGTGAPAHSAALQALASRRHLRLDESGLHRGATLVAGASEAAIYDGLGLAFIAPELREDRGEVAAAARGGLPTLIERSDLQGDLRVRTREPCSLEDLAALAQAARAAGLDYLAVADPARRAGPSRDGDVARLSRQIDLIDRLNAAPTGVTFLKGALVDILEDGTLSMPAEILGRLDLVVASVNHAFDLTRVRQTERVLRAMDNPHFSILAHPTGRLIEERRPCAIDLPRVLRQARERGCFVELDGQPARLDIDDLGCREAKAAGVLVGLASAAQDAAGLANLGYGIGQARRGWLEKADVLNTRPLAALRALLAPTMSR